MHLTKKLSSLKIAKNMCTFIALMGSTSCAGIYVAWLKLTTLPRSTVNGLPMEFELKRP